MPCPFRAHAVPLPCRAAKGLECVFQIWFTQCGRVWFTLAVPRSCHALTMPFFWRPRHNMAVSRRSYCAPAGFEPAIPASERPQTHALDLLDAGIGVYCNCDSQSVSSVCLYLITSLFINWMFSFVFTLLKCHLHSIDIILIPNFLVHSLYFTMKLHLSTS